MKKSNGSKLIGFLALAGIGLANVGTANAVTLDFDAKSAVVKVDQLSVYESLSFHKGGTNPDLNEGCTINESCNTSC